LTASVLRHAADLVVMLADGNYRLSLVDPLAPRAADDAEGGRLTAPMPGKVTEVRVESGARVRRGEILMVLEAMKMEHAIVAPADGRIANVNFAAGDAVEEGADLIDFSAEA
jgi:3-methylcrotonyl-CoA carboxylase alpha subunit